MARNKEIEIDTRLGRRCIDADKVIHFPRGLAGFENERDFILLQIRPDAPLLILQSVTTPVVGLLVADPYSFFDKSYAPQVSDAEKQLLSIESLEQAALLVTVSIPAGAPEKAPLTRAIDNYYMTDAITRASQVMAQATASFVKGADDSKKVAHG